METVQQTLQERRATVVRTHVEAENRHDIAAALKTFARPHYDVVALGAENDGAESVEALLAGLFGAFPDFHVRTLNTFYCDEAVIEEWEMTGTHQGLWAGIPATGRAIKLRIIGVFRFDEDRLMSESVYFDHATLLRQIGAM